MMQKCRMCGSQHMTNVMHLSRVPQDVQRLLSKPDPTQGQQVDIELWQCQDCGDLQSPMNLVTDYYDDYLMSTTFSQQLMDYLDALVEEFVVRFDLAQARVIDIGSGDGAFMLPFHRRGIAVEGIEPSDRSRAAAKAKGLKVHPGYVSVDTKIPGGPYHAFVSRQVLEHVDDVQGLLAGIRSNLAPGAVGIIEVPRVEKALQDLRFYDFFPDHVNYFSLESLRSVLERNGFEVLDLRATMYDEYNVAMVRMRQPQDFSALTQHRQHLIKEIEDLFRDHQSQGHDVAIWGAGAKGLSIMSALDADLEFRVIDSDTNKLGRFIPRGSILIEDPSVINQVDLIVISAIAYQNAILEKLRKFQYHGQVYVITAQGLKEQSL